MKRPHLYGTWRWQKKRKAFLDANPLCIMCMADGQTVIARIADHIIPHRGNEDLFWNGELQPLCKRHHDSDKQRIERGGKAKHRTGTDGWPI